VLLQKQGVLNILNVETWLLFAPLIKISGYAPPQTKPSYASCVETRIGKSAFQCLWCKSVFRNYNYVITRFLKVF